MSDALIKEDGIVSGARPLRSSLLFPVEEVEPFSTALFLCTCFHFRGDVGPAESVVDLFARLCSAQLVHSVGQSHLLLVMPRTIRTAVLHQPTPITHRASTPAQSGSYFGPVIAVYCSQFFQLGYLSCRILAQMVLLIVHPDYSSVNGEERPIEALRYHAIEILPHIFGHLKDDRVRVRDSFRLKKRTNELQMTEDCFNVQ